MERAPRRQWLWRAAETTLTLTVIGFVGWRFAGLLKDPALWARRLRPDALLLAGSIALYYGGLAASGVFWHLLLRALGQRPPSLAITLRAFFIGQLGRYVPGKAVGVWWRASLLRGPGVRGGVAALSVVYEALVTLVAGALLAGVVLATVGLPRQELDWLGWALILGLVALLTPPIFNRFIAFAVRPFRDEDATPLPKVRPRTLALGLALGAGGWLLQGASLLMFLHAWFPGAADWSAALWLRCAAYAGFSYAVGFVVIVVPGGLGVREFFVQRFLAAEFGGTPEAASLAALAALLLRACWFGAEIAAAAACGLAPRVVGWISRLAIVAQSETATLEYARRDSNPQPSD